MTRRSFKVKCSHEWRGYYPDAVCEKCGIVFIESANAHARSQGFASLDDAIARTMIESGMIRLDSAFRLP